MLALKYANRLIIAGFVSVQAFHDIAVRIDSSGRVYENRPYYTNLILF